ncbi:MAG: LLM class flavin-dependent oxidoreductase [Rhodospirillaceae bacterium]|jgi:alkanesulfonate monooxygenase SsuD/methylene tetrahydromethanopterin reductase-like flavin-dependent oxidoreductase (luciferase family)|nr:LLM class flavin-dependent oxidoreductase [Rhodospirillaceae bacterium]MBT6119062.1 LLM class flavin-dependent oxidoreductase [Rhodospirillaceae bacterium]
MKFDLFNLMQKRDESWKDTDVFDDVKDQIMLAEETGMETAWFAEHHFNNYSLCPSPLMAAAWAAGFTSKIRVGSAVLVLPLYNPMRVAQEIAMVDTVSNGRFVLGVGSGYQEYEFVRFGTKLSANIETTMEILDIIELALTQAVFKYDGKHFQIPETQIAIKSVQKPMPETWVAGLLNVPTMQERVARSGYVPFLTPSWSPIESLNRVHETYGSIYERIGKDPAKQPLSIMRFTHITDSKDEARDAAERARYSSRVSLALRLKYEKFNGIYVEEAPAQDEPSLDEMVDNYLIGDSETVIEKILHDHEVLGHSHVAFNLQLGGVPHDRVMKTLEKLGSDVIPGVKKALKERGADEAPVIRQQPQFAQAAE